MVAIRHVRHDRGAVWALNAVRKFCIARRCASDQNARFFAAAQPSDGEPRFSEKRCVEKVPLEFLDTGASPLKRTSSSVDGQYAIERRVLGTAVPDCYDIGHSIIIDVSYCDTESRVRDPADCAAVCGRTRRVGECNGAWPAYLAPAQRERPRGCGFAVVAGRFTQTD